MISSDQSASISTAISFSDVVDEACDRLWDKQVQYSIRRIHEMEDVLGELERELDQFILHKAGK